MSSSAACSGVVLYLSWRLGKKAVDVLLDKAPTDLKLRIEQSLVGFDGIEGQPRIRVRQAGDRMFADIELRLRPGIPIIEVGLKRIQGKGIVNSISMKEGEDIFKEHARLARRYGASVIVMAFDEDGQADTLQRKVEICRRAFRILVDELGFPPEDVIFDPNVLTVATGIEEHDNYAVNFIEAVRLIKRYCPGSPIPCRRPLVTSFSVTTTRTSLQRAAIFSSVINNRRRRGFMRSWKLHPWMVCTMTGVFASLATILPRIPAFELWV